jgi:hypothetical protein
MRWLGACVDLGSRLMRERSGTSYRNIFSTVDRTSPYRVISCSTGILAKPYSWRIASLCLVGISSPGWWVKSRGGVAGGIDGEGWWGKHSLKTRTLVGRLVTKLPPKYANKAKPVGKTKTPPPSFR